MISDDEIDMSMFEEPADFRPPKPREKHESYTRINGQTINLTLIGEHSLWSHYVWNAGKWFADEIDSNPGLVKQKSVLELGAGAALPSMISVFNDAKFVCCTDFNEPDLIRLLESNFDGNVCQSLKDKYEIVGFTWGSDESELVAPLTARNLNPFYDVIILCDVVFNHSEHEKLLAVCSKLINPDGGVIHCIFTHHRVRYVQEDLSFFKKALDLFSLKSTHCKSEKVGAMFKDDPGDLEIRSLIHYYQLFKE